MIFNCACGEKCDGITAFADHYYKYKYKGDGREHYWKTKPDSTGDKLVEDMKRVKSIKEEIRAKKKYKVIYKG